MKESFAEMFDELFSGCTEETEVALMYADLLFELKWQMHLRMYALTEAEQSEVRT